jgi:NTE family protein
MTLALVLSGGGARGDFEFGALQYLYRRRGADSKILVGTSVGSLNVLKLAEGNDPTNSRRGYPDLERMWLGLQTNSDMYGEAAWLGRNRRAYPQLLDGPQSVSGHLRSAEIDSLG